MNPRSYTGIRGRLVSLILLGLFPVFVLVILGSLSERKSVIDASYEDTKRLARLAAAKEGALIEGARQLTIALSVLPAVVHRDQATCNSFARNLLSAYPQYTNFGVVDVKGSVWCSSLPTAAQTNLGDRPYIRHALDKKEPSLSGYQIGRLTGLPSIVYANPIVDPNGASAGAAFASLRAEAFGVLGKDGDMPKGAVYLVVDHDGRILQRFPDGPHAQGKDISGPGTVPRGIRPIERVVGDEWGRWHYAFVWLRMERCGCKSKRIDCHRHPQGIGGGNCRPARAL